MTKGKPNLVILFSAGRIRSFPFSDPEYYRSYRDLFSIADAQFCVYVVRGLTTYRGSGVFRNGYRWNGRFLVPQRRRIAARVIFNKTSLRVNGGFDWTVVNRAGLHRIALNKEVTHRIFPRLMKAAFRIHSRHHLLRVLHRIRTSKAVFKPHAGAMGRGIVIAEKDALVDRIRDYNGLLEEFIDTSGGIPRLTKSYHDLRMTIMDGKLVETFIRAPQRGSFVANIAAGGILHEFPTRRLPQAARRMAAIVDQRMQQYGHRIYSVDVGFEGRKPYLIEINDRPGFPYKHGLAYAAWHRALLNVFIAADRDLRHRKV